MNQFNQQFITAIIDRYGLEPDDDHIDRIVSTWLQTYDRAWIVKAIIESLHRGRYKVKSVDSILSSWQRMGQPTYKFTPEFEREILQNLPMIADLTETPGSPMSSAAITTNLDNAELLGIKHPALTCDQLNPEESAPFLHYDRVIPTAYPPIRRPEGITHNHPQPEVARPLPPAIIQTKQITTDQRQEDLTTNQVAPLAVNFQLFQTLRAIVEPNYPQSVDIASFEVAPEIANFRFSLSSVSGD
jgi:hypothetical protein